MRRPRRAEVTSWRKKAFAVLLMILTVAPAAGARIIDCPGVTTTSGFKVLLDDVTFLSATAIPPANLEAIMGRLRHKLETDLQTLRLDPATSVKVLRCMGRQPRGEGDFDPPLVQVLDSREVVLEVWGSVLPSDTAAGSDALIGFVLIPVRSRERGAGPVSGFYEVPYQSSPTAPSGQLLDLFKNALELQAFLALSVGLNQLQARQYDLARSSLCRAELLLKQGRPAGDAMVVYVKRLGAEILNSARRDATYHGLLKATQIGACDASP